MERLEHCRLRVSLLGGLSVSFLLDAEAAPVTRFATHKTAALLALLALSPGRRFSREVLIDRLWPEAALDDGRRSLRVALAALRRILEPTGTPSGAVLQADRDSVKLRAETVCTDVAEFEQALRRGDSETARTLYASGPLLPAFYDDWVLVERERLEDAHTHLLPSRAKAIAVDAPPPPSPPFAPLSPDRDVKRPFYLTRFIGRETEREALSGLWDDARNRLITVTGPGGVGKTRFVSEVLAGTTSDRLVRFVPLADAFGTPTLLRRVAVALGSDPAKATAASIGHSLQTLGPVRLVLDNFEQLVAGGSGDIVLTWLASLPHLQVVVTSRQRLNLAGERELALEPLETPTQPATPERLLDFACVRLLIDRARLIRPDVALTARTADTVAALCQRLDGLPLALEITAAWAGALTFRQMLSRVEAHLLDESGPPTAYQRAARPPRHRTLRAALDVSLELLSPSLRQSFAALAVFRGGFTADAAIGVLGEEAGSHETLSRLRERSLLTTDAPGDTDELRFRLLPTVNVYAHECLETSAPQAAVLARAHCTYYLHLAQAPRLSESILDPETENVHQALETAEGLKGETDLQLCSALWPFWKARGHGSYGLQRLERALARHPMAPVALVLEARHGAALLAFDLCLWDDSRRHHNAALELARSVSHAGAQGRAYQGLAALALHADTDMALATELAQAARAQFQAAGEAGGESRSLMGLGVIATQTGDFDAACRFQFEGLRLAETTSDSAGIATAQHLLGNTLMRRERYDEALSLYDSALARFQQLGSRLDIAYTLTDMATLAYYQDNVDQAATHYETAIPIMRTLGDLWALSLCLGNVGRLATDTGDLPRAKRYLCESLAIRAQLGDKHALLQALDAIINALIYAALPEGKPVRKEPAREAIRLRAADISQRTAFGLGLAFEHDVLAPKVPRLRRAVGESECRQLEAEGAALSLEEAATQAQTALEKLV